MWAPLLSGKAVTLYNDNAAAAAAIATKAPALWRSDLQYLIREIAKLAIHYKFYFWGIHVNGKKNDIADALSRFKSVQWEYRGFDMVDAHAIVEEHFDGLSRFHKNRDPDTWQWTDEQKDILHIKRENKRDIYKELGKERLPKKEKTNEETYNILERKSFD